MRLITSVTIKYFAEKYYLHAKNKRIGKLVDQVYTLRERDFKFGNLPHYKNSGHGIINIRRSLVALNL